MNKCTYSVFSIALSLSAPIYAKLTIPIANTAITINLVQDDLTKQKVDAIVNAANRFVHNGGGVTGAIFKATGVQQLEKMISLYPTRPDGTRCLPGNVLATKACGNLLDYGIKYIIHAVGPDCRIPGQNRDKESLLRSAYRESLTLASKLKLRSIAFPSISTGIYGYAINQAAPIALDEIMKWVTHHKNPSLQEIRIVLLSDYDYQIYAKLMSI